MRWADGRKSDWTPEIMIAVKAISINDEKKVYTKFIASFRTEIILKFTFKFS